MVLADEADFIVIGAGMAGASAAAALSAEGRVLLLEAEPQAGYHTTGRSAAVFSEIYGNALIRALTRASRSFFFEPPEGFAPVPLVQPRGTLYFAGPGELPSLRAFREDRDIEAATMLLSARESQTLVPAFKPGWLEGAALETGSADIDVDALHQGFLRHARQRGALPMLGCPVSALRHSGGRWIAETPQGRFGAPVLVNAAGAWADEVAKMAGVRPVGLQPMRRTVVTIDTPAGADSQAWPAAIHVGEQFYFKPETGGLLLSPADEVPSPPCDAQPEELDIAIAIDRFEQATGAAVRKLRHRWAGLRVFSADRSPVVGFDAEAEGFFWLAGQGGYGIQTAPALGRAAAALALHAALPHDLTVMGIDPAALAGRRFSNTMPVAAFGTAA